MSPEELPSRVVSPPAESCFLCSPAPELIYAQSANFVALLGVGPIREGYSLIATNEHVPSMLDLPGLLRKELADFSCHVRDRLEPHYGPSLVTEHGRVPPCLSAHAKRHEPHCLHAHRLVFPGADAVDLSVLQRLRAKTYASFDQAAASFRDPGQYLYAERPDGSCQVASIFGPFPRQFFRRLVAAAEEKPELSDWKQHPGLPVIAAARARLNQAA